MLTSVLHIHMDAHMNAHVHMWAQHWEELRTLHLDEDPSGKGGEVVVRGTEAERTGREGRDRVGR